MLSLAQQTPEWKDQQLGAEKSLVPLVTVAGSFAAIAHFGMLRQIAPPACWLVAFAAFAAFESLLLVLPALQRGILPHLPLPRVSGVLPHVTALRSLFLLLGLCFVSFLILRFTVCRPFAGGC